MQLLLAFFKAIPVVSSMVTGAIRLYKAIKRKRWSDERKKLREDIQKAGTEEERMALARDLHDRRPK
jgi:signal transduction histidine kinase